MIVDAVRMGRLVAIAVMTYLTWQFVRTPLDGSVNESFLHLPDLVFHEAGHILFIPFGRFLTVLGGSLFQVLVPVICAVAFAVQQRDWFASAVCVWWGGQNLIDLAPYIADARALQMVLIGGRTGAEVEGHDWEYLLTAMGVLHQDAALGRFAYFVGALVMIGSLGWAVTLVLRHRERDA